VTAHKVEINRVESKKVAPGGHHLMLDLEECRAEIIGSADKMKQLLSDAARKLKVNLIGVDAQELAEGISAIGLVSESHLSVHTWPKQKKAFADIFTCQATFDSQFVTELFFGATGAKRVRSVYVQRKNVDQFRGEKPPKPSMFEMDLGRSIFAYQSPYQFIEMSKGPLGVTLFLDGQCQFVEKVEKEYHEWFVHPPMVCAEKLEKVGVGGGGDGMTMREVLRYKEVKRAVQYELDPFMLLICKSHPEMARMNAGALEDARAEVHADNALDMLRPGAGFDVLLLDFPSPSQGNFDMLYSVDFYGKCAAAMSEGAVLMTQVTDFEEPLKKVERNLMQVFPYVAPLDLQHLDLNYVMASKKPFEQKRRLPQGLQEMNQKDIGRALSAVQQRFLNGVPGERRVWVGPVANAA
jgi:spermidine synthase